MQLKNYENDTRRFLTNYKKAIEKAKEGIYLFGAGQVGMSVAEDINQTSMALKGYVDNSYDIIGKEKNGLPIISFQEYEKSHLDCLLVVSVGRGNRQDVITQIEDRGLRCNEDFVVEADEFLRRVEFLEYNRIIVPLVQISVTERCTLKCEKCAHACNLVEKDKNDMDIEEAKKTVDGFFEVADACKEFVLIGGEPLLYKCLPELIEYIGVRYRSQIQTFSITTNGTLSPSKDLLDKCLKHDVIFRISNYSKTLPYIKEKIERMTQLLEKYNIRYILAPDNQEWMDYGFGIYDRGDKESELIKAFDECKTICHEIRNGRFYYCVMARSVSENLHFNVGKDDYFDLSSIKNESDREVFFEYLQGYSDKGYLDMCRYCRGKNAINYPIPPAVQKDMV